ncbi:MAG: peptidyl-prolyl cis-trans isomerase [candidate division WOR-3 bacterium]|nr:MAG: peptidyl-prolyl cis-trans isomerase [candidate division WOR-3 bacterium]
MALLFALLISLPQDYIDLLMQGKYEEAIAYCNEMISKPQAGAGCFLLSGLNGKKTYMWELEKGDIYFNKLAQLDSAAQIYQKIIDAYQQKDGWVYYRLAQVFEMKEDFLNAAKAYEIVATRFRTPPLDSFSLTGVERCFKKNYQDFVATIDDYNITRLELDEQMKRTLFGKKDVQSVLDRMITERLIYTNAIKENVQDTEFFKENIASKKRSFLVDEVRESDIVSKSIPTEKEMKKYYKDNKENYKLREEVRGKEIVVDSDSLAQFILDSLKIDAASFDTLAKLYSTAANRNSGGNMGIVYRGTKPAPVDSMLFRAEMNTVTDIVPYDDKFGIYIVTEHNPKRYRDFEEVKTSIEAAAKTEKLRAIEKEFSQRLRSGAQIEIYEEPQDSVIAVVNGRLILRSDIERLQETHPQFAKMNLTDSVEFKKAIDKYIDEELQVEWAEQHKYFLNDSYFTKLQAALTELMSRGLYIKVVVEAVSVDSEEVKDYYTEHKDDFKIPESVRAREIVVEERELAQQIRNVLLKNPTAFDSLAKTHSIGAAKSRGGSLGLVRRGMKPKKFDDVVFTLRAGEMSRVFSADDKKYTIVVVDEYNPETYRPFEEVQQHIEANLLRQKQGQVVNEFLATIREEADIQIFLEEPEEKAEEQIPKPEQEKMPEKKIEAEEKEIPTEDIIEKN